MRKSVVFGGLGVLALVLIGLGIYGGFALALKGEQKGCLAENFQPTLAALTAEPGVTRMLVLGDVGEENGQEIAVAKAAQAYCLKNGCDFGLLLGDNFYENGIHSTTDPLVGSVYTEHLAKLGLPFYVVLGNHDVKGSVKAQVALTYTQPNWRMPDYSYRLETNNAELLAMNTNCGAFNLVALLIHQGLVDKNKWRIAFGHHPVYAEGGHGSAGWPIRVLWKYFLAKDFDFYLSGHNHLLEAWQEPGIAYLTSGAGSRLTSDREDGSEKPLNKVGLVVYKNNDPNKKGEVFLEQTAGFLWIELRPGAATYRFVGASGAVLYEGQRNKD